MAIPVEDRIIAGLDAPDWGEASSLLEGLPEACRWVKVGKELFTREGPAAVEGLRQRGKAVFLDLKYHDIPNTVAGACRAAAALSVGMITVHASGGSRMMEAAREAVGQGSQRPWVLGVTVLTSMEGEDLRSVGVTDSPEEQVRRLARLARESGLDGVIASPGEVARLRPELGPDFRLVVPGIRPSRWRDADDQRRTGSPGRALADGADYLVIGRPLLRAEDPAGAWRDLLEEAGSASS